MKEIICPLCQARILVLPNMQAMIKAIDKHVNCHTKEMEEKKLPEPEIEHAIEELEEALAQEVLKNVANNSDANDNTLGQTTMNDDLNRENTTDES
jgi:hypothetical protein